MVRKILLTAIVLAGAVAVPRPALAGCTTNMMQCFEAAAKIGLGNADLLLGFTREKLLEMAECARSLAKPGATDTVANVCAAAAG